MTAPVLQHQLGGDPQLALVAGPLAVWDPNRPNVVHLARVGGGLVCPILRGTAEDRQPGGHLPLGVEWCWERAADNPPNCPDCLVMGGPEGRLLNPEAARRLLHELTRTSASTAHASTVHASR